MSLTQDTYDKVDFELAQLEKDFLELEKNYFDVKPLFDGIENRIMYILEQMKGLKANSLGRRIANFRASFKKFKEKLAYDKEDFQLIFQLLRIIVREAPHEILSPRLYDKLKEKIKIELNPEVEGQSAIKNAKSFLMVANGRQRFLIPYEKKLWLSLIKLTKGDVAIKIKKVEEPNVFNFIHLPGHDFGKAPEKKVAILVELEQKRSGFIVDELEGSIFLKPGLLKKKLQYFKLAENRFERYMMLRGERYFLRKL